jgi:hypothetical protein
MIQPNMSPVLYRMCVKDTAARADALLNSRVGTARISVLFIINVFFSHINSSKFLRSHMSNLSCYIHRPTQSSLLSMEWNGTIVLVRMAFHSIVPFHCSIPFHSILIKPLRVSYHFRVSDTSSSTFGFFDLVVVHPEGALLNRCGLQTSSSLEAHRGIPGLLDTAHVHSWKHCALEAQCNILASN